MSGLGVPDSAFFRLQEDMIQRLAQMLIDEQQAAVALSQVNTGSSISHKSIHKIPSQLTAAVEATDALIVTIIKFIATAMYVD